MAITAVLKYQNADSTQDLNSRFEALFQRGVLTGGTITVVSGSLEVDVQPLTAFSDDGMLVTSDGAERVTIPLDQTNIISLFAQYVTAGAPVLEIRVNEASVFNGLIDRDFHIVIGAVTTASPATEVTITDISYALRERQDRREELTLRGRLISSSLLPVDPNFNFPGDSYIIAPGGAVIPAIYSWDGSSWVDITATAGIISDLALHRANLFPNEIHMTDDQADAATGSSGSPSAVNRFVTEADTRLPTQPENDALIGSTGAPSSTNKYITEEYPVTAPEILPFPAPPGGIILIGVAATPVFVGTGATLSEIKYFNLLDFTIERGYVNTSGIAPKVIGTFKDVFLAAPLVPSVDANSEGYFTGNLYLSVDNVIDTPVRLIYGKKTTLKAVLKDFAITVDTGDDVVPGEAVQRIANIKGRDFDIDTPTAEQNINLRLDLDGLSAYTGSVLETNVIAGNEDFARLADDPILGPSFVKNLGVDNVFTFENLSLVSFAYTPATGVIQYGGIVGLSFVNVGDLFTDGSGVTFEVIAVDDGGNNVTIVSRDTGSFPQSVNASVGTSLDGSTKVNFNPRDLLLAEMKFSSGSEIIKTPEISRIVDEFSRPDGLVGFGITRFDFRFEPRLVFYGSWENHTTTNQERYVRNPATGRFEVTGYFTELVVLMRRKTFSPALNIKINNISPATVITTTALGTVNAAVGASTGAKYHRVVIASGMTSGQPNHVRADITAITADTLDIFGFEFIRDSNSSGFLESGRAFDNARIVPRDTQDIAVPVFQLAPLQRGGRLVYSVASQTFGTAIFTMADLDENSIPAGTVGATTSQITITTGVAKLANYRVGDVIQLISVGLIETRRIASIASPLVTMDAATAFVPTTVVSFRHIASTDLTVPNVGQEEFMTRLVLLEEFINYTPADLRTPDARDRVVVSHDGHTILAAKDAVITASDVSGNRAAFQVQTATSGDVRITTICTRLDILAVNGSAATVGITVDGSTSFTLAFAAGSARRTIMFNARYQSHEIVMSPISGNLSISEIFLFGPFKPFLAETPNEIADLNRVARFVASSDLFVAARNIFPTGGIFYEATQNISYLNGTGTGTNWTVVENFAKSIYGQYVAADREAASLEFYFLGTCFELQFISGPDHGTFKVQVDGTQLESAGGTIIGDYTGNEVDAYTAVYGRRNIGIEGLTFGYHKITANVKAARTKNGASTGFFIAFNGYYVGNEEGYLAIGRDREGVFTSTVDLRNFVPLDLTQLPDEVGVSTSKAAKVAIGAGLTSIAVVYPEPYVDNNYVVMATFSNTVDAFPTFQSIVISAQSSTGFTATWNNGTATANYVLAYYTNVLE